MGPAGPALVMAMAPPVPPCGDSPHPTVLDPWVATDHPAAGSGDVGGTDEVPVSAEGAERTAEGSPPGLGDPAPADRAGRGGPPLVRLDHLDARHLRLVLEGADEMGAPPVAQPQVLAPAGVPVADAFGVPDPEGPYPVLDRPGDDALRRLVVAWAWAMRRRWLVTARACRPARQEEVGSPARAGARFVPNFGPEPENRPSTPTSRRRTGRFESSVTESPETELWFATNRQPGPRYTAEERERLSPSPDASGH